MREITCCFTGHRNIPEETRGELEARLDKAVRALAEEGISRFCAGGALSALTPWRRRPFCACGRSLRIYV